MASAKDGEEACTTGMAYSLEAGQIKLIKKGASHPDTSGYSYLEIPAVTCSSLVEGSWQNDVSAGKVSGTTGKGIPITRFSVKTNSPVAGGINYRLHLSNEGWTSDKSNGGQLSSSAGFNSVEAIRISLSGDLATFLMSGTESMWITLAGLVGLKMAPSLAAPVIERMFRLLKFN